jgi:hypothetical protein
MINLNLEDSIKDVISKKLEDGTIKKIIAEQLENAVVATMKNLFNSYGNITKILEEKIKSVMVPYLENYDYSDYIVKLDEVMGQVLKNSALENKKLLENFKHLTDCSEKIKEIKLSEMFEKWKEFVEENVNTTGLKIDLDRDEPAYGNVFVELEVKYDDIRSWDKYEYANIVFECEHDEKMNFSVRVWKGRDEKYWTLYNDFDCELSSLRNLNSFKILLMKLRQSFTRITIDIRYEESEIEPKERPEATFS